MQKHINPITATFYCFLSLWIVATLTSNPAETVRLTSASMASAIPLMLGIGICTTVLPYFLYTLALKYLPVGTASALSIVEPMAATIYSLVLFREPMNAASVCGALLILGAVLLLSRSKE